MPLIPERVKYRKMHRGSRTGLAQRGGTVAFGEYGLQALERCWLDTKQVEAARVAVTRFMKRRGKVWIRIFPRNPTPKSPWKPAWARARVPWNPGSPSSAPPTSSLKWTACPKPWPANPCAWPPTKLPIRTKFHFTPPHGLADSMKMSELKDLTPAELGVKSRDLRQELFQLRLNQASSQLEHPAKMRLLRRDVARIETRLSQLRSKPA